MPQTIFTHQYDNGLALVAEQMEWLESAAMALLLPAGCSRDPADRPGLANFTAEMVERGCGPLDSRQFIEALERLGIDSGSAVTNPHGVFSAAMPAERLGDALRLHADLVRRPHLPPGQLEDGRRACMHEVQAIEDDLAQQVMQELRRRQYPDPWGRSAQGTAESIASITHGEIDAFFRRHYRPDGAILAVAGSFDWPALQDRVGELLGDWPRGEPLTIDERPPVGGYAHLPGDSTQTHIGVAYASIPCAHPDYYCARAAVGVLSDGMSSRLFDEVREKRGLCYSIFASSHSLRDRGSVMCYAGTTTDRAQETLDVLVAELRRLTRGVEPEELDRLKARIKSALIMQQESSSSRAGSIAADWFLLGRVRPREEIRDIIDRLSAGEVNRWLAANPPGALTVVTLGAEPLRAADGTADP